MAKKTEKVAGLMGLFQTLTDDEQAQFINITRRLEVNASDEQNFTNVTKAMQAAGYNPFKRAAAGAKAYARNRMEATKGINSRKSARALRLFGMGKSADFIDKWLTKAPPAKISPKRKKAAKTAIEKDLSTSTSKKIDTGSGSLIAITKQLTFISASIERMAEDIGDIKSLIMPREITAKGETIEGDWNKPDTSAVGKTQTLLYNPLAPAGDQFLQVKRPITQSDIPGQVGNWEMMTKPGRLTKKGADKGFERDAKRKAAKETADLALKIIEKDRERVELKKKYEYKDKAERQTDPLEVLRADMDEKFDKIFKRLDEKKRGSILDTIMGAFGGLWNKITSFFKNPFGILTGLAALMPLASLIAKGGLVGMAGVIGYQVGTWLNEKFKLSEKINDAIQFGMKLFGKSNEDKILASDKSAVEKKNRKSAEINVKLEGTGYKKEDMTISKDGTVYHGGGYVDAEGNRILVKDLPPEVKKIIGVETDLTKDAPTGPKSRTRRGRTAPSPVAPAAPAAPAASKPIEPAITSFPPMPSEMPAIEAEGKTGMITKEYDSRLKQLGDIIASGESKGDYNIFNKGTVGKNAGKIGRENLSKMTISEYLRRSNLDKDDPKKMFAVGKYQIIPDTMRDAVQKLGLNPDTTTLDPQTQENIFKEYLTKSRRPKIHEYLTGKSDDLDAAILEMSKEWASVGVPHDVMRGNTLIKKGQSYYSGIGGNKAHTSAESIASVITPTKAIPGSRIDGDSRILQASNSPSSVNMFGAPTTINATRVSQTVGKRPVAKADVLTRDPSIIRTTSRDAVHPVYG